MKLDWNYILPNDMLDSWKDIMIDFQIVVNFIFPRRLLHIDNSKIILHAFVNVSNNAYCASVYTVNGKESSLVCAKARVVPIKPLIGPKMELAGVLLELC